PGNEKDVAVKLKNYMDSFKIHNELYSLENNRANFIASLNSDYHGETLIYNGHMDVVPPGEIDDWKYPPLSAHIKRNKYMYGRGTSDMKGALVAMIIALKILKGLDLDTKRNLIVLAVCDEETLGELGAQWSIKNILEEKSIDSSFAIVGEVSGLPPLPKALIVGEKGHVTIKIVTHGIECHSSIPFEGKNAIYMMSDIIQNLDKINEYFDDISPPISRNELMNRLSEIFPTKDIFEKIFNEQPRLQNFIKALNTFTKNLNIIEGGVKDNVIPGKCEAIMDFRTLPGINSEMIIDALTQLINIYCNYEVKEEHKRETDELYVSLEVLSEAEASYWEGWESSSRLKTLKSYSEKIYGNTSFYSLFPATTDARYFRNSGFCPKTIVYGPGDGSITHSVNEYIEIEDFINIIKVYTLFGYNFLTSP
ncbi:MAG: M20 family peptidase, partial [Promethearchaeota archaeon]